MSSGTPSFDRDRLPPGAEPRSSDDPLSLGPYEIVGRLGAGGMGAVHAGLDQNGGCAAVKVVHEHFADDPEFRARFAREADLVARVRATCTPAFLGADAEAEAPWLATEYVPGPTLRQYVREHGPLSGGTLTALAVGLAEALVAIHAAGVLHRDLEPGNVILAPEGPKVLDFGIVRAADGTALTATGGLPGTPGWVPPERYEGDEAAEWTDMFAWGGLVLLAATGRNPFGSGDAEEVAHRVRSAEADLTGLPGHLVPLVHAALSPDPRRRPTASQALAELTGRWRAARDGGAVHRGPVAADPGGTGPGDGALGNSGPGSPAQSAVGGPAGVAPEDPAENASEGPGAGRPGGLAESTPGDIAGGAPEHPAENTPGSPGDTAPEGSAGVVHGSPETFVENAAGDPTKIVPEILATEWRGLGNPTPGPGGTGRRGKALLLSGGAVVLVAALLGTWFVFGPGGTGGGGVGGAADGEEAAVEEQQEQEQEQAPVVAQDPEDTGAVIEEAVELALDAPDHQYRREWVAGAEMGHPSIEVVEYTEEPVLAQQVWSYAPAGSELRLRYGDDLEEELGGVSTYLGEDPEEYADSVEYYERDFDDQGHEGFDPHLRDVVQGIELLTEDGAQVDYQGQSWVPVTDTSSTGVGGHVEFEEAQGHHYTGSYTGEEGEETFDLWIDEEGYPLRFATFVEGDAYAGHGDDNTAGSATTDYNFGEPVDIHIPGDEEILPGYPEHGGA